MKFWHSNRLDQEAEHDPVDVARQFIAACRNGWEGFTSSRPSMEFAFRWWLTDPKAFNASWDEKDSDELMDALEKELEKDPAARDFIWDTLMEPHRKREAPSA